MRCPGVTHAPLRHLLQGSDNVSTVTYPVWQPGCGLFLSQLRNCMCAHVLLCCVLNLIATHHATACWNVREIPSRVADNLVRMHYCSICGPLLPWEKVNYFTFNAKSEYILPLLRFRFDYHYWPTQSIQNCATLEYS